MLSAVTVVQMVADYAELEPMTKYLFRIDCENSAGYSTPGESITYETGSPDLLMELLDGQPSIAKGDPVKDQL